ncbi:MAG: fasciclin domain-containing protein [Planctomycetota bacterium]
MSVVSTTAPAAGPGDIVDTAASVKDFSTLVAAVKAAGLVDALKGEGPFTVFAPTNEAFERIADETLASLLEPANKDKLTNILLYHVVQAKVLAADVVNVSAADTLLEGQKVKVRVKGDRVYINGARVTKTDVETSNGVIHIIDTVLLPN